MSDNKTERRAGMNIIIPIIKEISKELKEVKKGQIETNTKVDFIHSKLFIQNGAPGLIQQFEDNDKALAKAIKDLDEKKIIPLSKSVGKVKAKVNKIFIFFTAVPLTIGLVGAIIGIVLKFTRS